MLNRRIEYEKMAATEERLWWYRILHRKMLSAIRQHTKSQDISILDIGCGTGGFLAGLRERGYARLRGVDISDDAIQFTAARQLPVTKGAADSVAELFPTEQFDVLVCADVLCYYEQHELPALLNSWRSLLRPGGIVVLNMPSLGAFRGMHDLSVGIRQRIDWPRFRGVLEQAGWGCNKAEHWPFVLSPLIALERRRQRGLLKNEPQAEIRSDVEMPNALVNQVLFGITCFEAVIPGLKWGSSLFAVVQPRP